MKAAAIRRPISFRREISEVFSKRFAKDLFNEIRDDHILTGAAALAFYLILAFFPAMIALLSVLPFLSIPNLDQEIMLFLKDGLPPQAFTLVGDAVKEITTKQQGGVLTFGVLFSLWSAASGFTAVIEQLNFTYDIKESRSFWKVRLIAIVLTLLLGVLVITSFGLIVFGGVLHSWLTAHLGYDSILAYVFLGARWSIIVLFLGMAFALSYYFGPDVEQKFRFITPGSVFGVAMLIIASLAFRFYVTRFGNYQAVYGSIGAAIVLLLWLYISGLIILLGSEINALIESYNPKGKNKGEKLPP